MVKEIRFIVFLFSICMLLPPVYVSAQTDSLAHRYITRATSYGIGYANVYDTYLSPQEYVGIDFRLSTENMRMTRMFNGNVSVQSFFQTNISYTQNRADNNNTFSGLVNWNYGYHYQFRINPNFKLLAGAMFDLNGGFIYNLRNSNNPASAKAYLNLAASGMALWNTRIGKSPVTLRYQLNVPFIGVMFSPHFGQSYYEIFTLNNSNGVVKLTSLHNQPSFRQILSIDFPLRYTKIRLSYVCDIQQSKINEIRAHNYSHVFMVGVVKDLLLLRDKKGSPLTPAIKAY